MRIKLLISAVKSKINRSHIKLYASFFNTSLQASQPLKFPTQEFILQTIPLKCLIYKLQSTAANILKIY